MALFKIIEVNSANFNLWLYYNTFGVCVWGWVSLGLQKNNCLKFTTDYNLQEKIMKFWQIDCYSCLFHLFVVKTIGISYLLTPEMIKIALRNNAWFFLWLSNTNSEIMIFPACYSSNQSEKVWKFIFGVLFFEPKRSWVCYVVL